MNVQLPEPNKERTGMYVWLNQILTYGDAK